MASIDVHMVEIWCLRLPSTYAFVIALKENQKYSLGICIWLCNRNCKQHMLYNWDFKLLCCSLHLASSQIFCNVSSDCGQCDWTL